MMKMRRTWILMAGLAMSAGGLKAQDYGPEDYLEARVWLDRGDDPVLQRGDRVRIYYRTSQDAYVAVFHIDSDGSVNLLHPRAPDEEHFVRAGRDYRLLFPRSQYWYVDEYPGKGYFFMVASQEPFDFGSFTYARYDRGWDLSSVGRTVYEDPYVAIDEYVERLIPNWETVPYALDFISYDVGEVHDYPRFLCYDCHGFRSYAVWNPYSFGCSTYRVVVWDDPYFYPTWRYRGTRVVYAQPRRGVPRFEFKERAVGETWTPMTRTRQPPLRRSTDYVEPSVAMPRGPDLAPTRRATPTQTLRPTTSTDRRNATPSVRPPARRPSSAAVSPSRPSTRSTRPATPDARRTTPTTRFAPATTGARERPTLQRRPTTSRTPTTRPSTSRPTTARPTARPSGGGRVTTPSRSTPTRSRPSATRTPTRSSPTVRPSRTPTSRARPTVRPRPTVKAKKPPPRRKPGGLSP